MSIFIVPNRINGIDVSSSNESVIPIDFQKVKDAGFEFVYIQSSRYSRIKDLPFDKLLDRARKAGLRVGAYHFLTQAKDTDPVKQAEFFHRACGGLGTLSGDLPPMVDFEFCTPSLYSDHPVHCVGYLETFIGALTNIFYPDNAKRLRPRYPVLYTYPNYSSLHQPTLGQTAWLAKHPLCYASYRRGRALPPEDHRTYHPVPKPWSGALLTQYSGNDGMPVPGVVGACDRQLWNGSTGEWWDFLDLDRPVHQTVKEIK